MYEYGHKDGDEDGSIYTALGTCRILHMTLHSGCGGGDVHVLHDGKYTLTVQQT